MDKIDTAIILIGQKNLDKINSNHEIIKKNIEKLLDANFQNIILSTNSFLDEHEKFCLDNNFDPMVVRVMKEQEPLGSGGAIKNVLLSINIENALILYSNSRIDFDINKTLDSHSKCEEKNSLLVFDSKSVISLKESEVKVKTDAFLVHIDLFNHTHLNKFSFIKDLLPLTYKDEYNYIDQGYW
mgnify:CR=1 FL=1